jgi:hypothetical protein
MAADHEIVSGSGEPGWTLGAFKLVVATGENTTPFDLHYISVSNMDTTGSYEFVLYTVDDDAFANPVEIARARCSRNTAQVRSEDKHIQVPVLAAGQRVACKMAFSTTAEAKAKISLAGHGYTVAT